MLLTLSASATDAVASTTSTVLSISDKIQLWGILLSTFASLVAIVISIASLRQNSKMLEEASRPNIQIYPIFMDSILYIVIKNFGASEAVIDELTCDHTFTKAETFGKDGDNIFSDLTGAIFSPGYSIRLPLVGHAVANEVFDFKISYHSAVKKYSAEFSFNPYNNAPFADTYPVGKSIEDHLHHIEKDLHGILKLKL